MDLSERYGFLIGEHVSTAAFDAELPCIALSRFRSLGLCWRGSPTLARLCAHPASRACVTRVFGLTRADFTVLGLAGAESGFERA